jgi:SAM-dependent methyltransferase
MHDTAMRYGKLFFEVYVPDSKTITIVDLGAQDVNGSLRTVAPPSCNYIGVDFEKARGVDVVITDPYELPFESESIDVCVSSSCYEHSEFFWLSFLEVVRIVKPGGLIYMNVPSNGYFHRYPVDCWRFYPDSGTALKNWACRNGFDVELLESFIGKQRGDIWNDFVAVFVKERGVACLPTERIINRIDDYTNGKVGDSEVFKNYSMAQEDQHALSTRIRKKFKKMFPSRRG